MHRISLLMDTTEGARLVGGMPTVSRNANSQQECQHQRFAKLMYNKIVTGGSIAKIDGKITHNRGGLTGE
jgi:hypothetical protein